MSMRLQELHPSLVHLPIAFYPASLAADAMGAMTDDDNLKDIGRRAMTATTVSAVVAAAAGLVAQESVRLSSTRAHERLVTHRNLNIGFLGMTTAMAAWRANNEPGRGYFATGLGGLVAVGISAYLGGKLVYEDGAGVEAAGGVRYEASPEMRRATAKLAAKKLGQNAGQGVKHAAEEIGNGEFVPALRRDRP